MTTIRRYRLGDIDRMIELLENNLKLTIYADVEFKTNKIRDLLVGNINNILVFCNVIIENDEIVGGMIAMTARPLFTDEVFVYDHFLYIHEDNRSLRSATELVATYVDWAKARKVRKCFLSNSMGVKVEQFARLAQLLKFKQVGTIHVMEIM